MLYTINGKFVCDKFTGMQRYAYEIIKELDKIAEPGEFELVIPKKAVNVPSLRNIKIVRWGNMKGIPWEQLIFPVYLFTHKRSRCANLLSIVPFLMPKGLIVAHGVNYKVNPQFFKTPRDKLSRLWHIVNFRWYFWFTKKIVTDSRFSEKEIMRTYHVDAARFSIVSCAWQHMNNIQAADDAFERYPMLEKGKYYFSLSSVNDNKNFKWIAQVAKKNPTYVFAIAGGRNLDDYLKRMGIERPDNLIFLGRISDEDMKAVLKECKAFLFPTLYEGFGIPPMEAMACGAKAIVSDTPTMHEIYGDYVYYIDPFDPDVDLEHITSVPLPEANHLLAKYSWEKSAKALYKVMKQE